jgi:hypothetical protein
MRVESSRWPLAATAAVLAAMLSATPAFTQCGLLSWDDYRAARHPLPYVLRLASSGELLMFGVRHTRNPRDPQIQEIERHWREIRPQIAFSEGGIRPDSATADEAVTRFGEPGLLRFLADRDHVELRSLDPAEDREAAALVPQFPPGQVKLFYFLRNLADSASDGRTLEERQRSALESVRHRQRLAGSPNSLKEIDALLARLLPQLQNPRSIPQQWFDPSRSDNFLNQISRSSSDFRNCHMAPLIVSAVRSGKRVFVLVGGSHVVILEPAIRSALH